MASIAGSKVFLKRHTKRWHMQHIMMESPKKSNFSLKDQVYLALMALE